MTEAATPQKTHWIKRATLIAIVVITAFLLLVIGAVFFIFDSEHGTQWSLQTAQRFLTELTIVDAHGSWVRGISAQQIAWRDPNTDIEVDRAELKLHWPNLLHGEIRLSQLHAQRLRIVPKGPSSDAPIKLPTVFLPFTLSTPDLALQQLDIVNTDSTFTLTNLHSGVVWRATALTLTQTQAHWNDIALNAQGSLNLRGDYPLRVKGQLSLPQWPSPIAVQTSGDLRHLQLQASSEAPYAIKAQLELATLDKHLPLQIRAELTQPFVHNFDAERIEIRKGVFDARGDLTQIDGHLALALIDSRYGASEFNSALHWQPEQLHTQMQWLLSSGRVSLNCDATLNKPIGANCSGNIVTLSLTPWLPGPSGEISSAVKLEAQWFDPQWAFALALPDLGGKINNEALAANIDVRTDDGALWQLNPSSLAIGSNEIKASGQFGHRNHLQASVNARDLARLDARLAGSITGTIGLEGDSSTPTLRAALSAQKLRFDDARATQARLDLTLPKLGNDSGRGRLEIAALKIGDLTPIDLTLTVSGTRTQQRLALNAQQDTNRIALQCNTQSDATFDKWQLACPELSGRLHSGRGNRATNFDWSNSTAVRGHAQLTQRQFELTPFCLRGEGVELCLDQLLRYADNKLQPTAAHAQGIPLRWVRPWLPDDFMLINDARISAQAQLKSLAPLSAQASAQIPQTRWRWHTATATETAEINAIHLDATLDEQRAQFVTSAESPTLGRVAARLAILDPRNKRELDGRIDIERLQLSGFAWAFQGLDAISGEINGGINIVGAAAAPQLRGQLLLIDGTATYAPLGAPFRSVHADLTFDNNSAKLGGWFALGQGGGDIDGNLYWDGTGENWKLRIGLVAGGVSAMPLPNSTVIFSPHAELTAVPNEMHINGYVDIASAEIQLKQLPPDTTDVSQDQEIVGQQNEEDAWKIWAELGLNLGDQFHLNGFGADVNLSGRLQLSKAPGDVLHMTGEVKVPRGRYRAYGQRLTVRKGSVIFYGPLDNPDLNLEAVRDMPPGVTDVVGMRVIGSLKTPEAILFSEPSMPDSDIAYYLLTGRKPVAGATGTSGYSASGALLSLGMAGSEGKAGQLAQKFGITDLQLGTSESATGESEAEVSGQLGKDLFVRYGRGLGQRSNSISFQYRLTPKFMIETISGIEDALDLLYSFEIK